MKVYIAGPMKGLPGCNFPAFDGAAAAWRAAGHHPVSPADLDRLLGVGATEDGRFSYPQGERLVHTMFALLSCVSGAEAIALLPGWENSTGATMELAAAQFLGLRVYDAVTMLPLDPPQRPWEELRNSTKRRGGGLPAAGLGYNNGTPGEVTVKDQP